MTSAVIDEHFTGGNLPVSTAQYTGTYIIGADHRGMIALTGGIQSQKITLDVALGSISSGVAAKGALIDTDQSTRGPAAGFLERQDTTAFSTSAMTGSYAFALRGKNSGFFGMSFAGSVGSFTANNGTITNGLTDVIDGGITASSAVLTGTYSISANGRGTATFSGIPSSPLIFYVISAKKWLIAGDGFWTGVVLQQSGAPFGVNSLNGTSLFEQSSSSSSGGLGSNVTAGLITFQGNGNHSFAFDQNNAGAVSRQNGVGTYSVSSGSNGRFTLIAQTISSPIVGYMVAPNEIFLLTEDQFGSVAFVEPQSGGPFTNASANGTFYFGTETLGAALQGDMSTPAVLQSGIFVANAGNVSITSDADIVFRGPAVDQFLVGSTQSSVSTDTYTVDSSGRVTTGSGSTVLYIVSPGKAISISLQNNNPNPTLVLAEQ